MDNPQVPADAMAEVMAQQTGRAMEILAALKARNVPLDALTGMALDYIGQQLESAILGGCHTDES